MIDYLQKIYSRAVSAFGKSLAIAIAVAVAGIFISIFYATFYLIFSPVDTKISGILIIFAVIVLIGWATPVGKEKDGLSLYSIIMGSIFLPCSLVLFILIPSCAIHVGINDVADRSRQNDKIVRLNNEAEALGFIHIGERASCSSAGFVDAKACKEAITAGGFLTAAELEEAKTLYGCVSQKCISDTIMNNADLMDTKYGVNGRSYCENAINDYIKNEYDYDFKTKTEDDKWDYQGYDLSYFGTIRYYTDDILLQTEFGPYRKSRLKCDYDVRSKTASGVYFEYK